MPAVFMLFLQSMDSRPFRDILEQAFQEEADAHNLSYPDRGAASWADVGAAYLGFALCGLPATHLRKLQYDARTHYGPVILDCKWYDHLTQVCLDGLQSLPTLLPGPDDTLVECHVDKELFLEMLDFCREG